MFPYNKVPIYTATKSLDVNYSFVYCTAEDTATTVPGANIHAALMASCNGMLDLRDNAYKTGIDDINLATAAVTMLYTDTSTEEGYLGEQVKQSTFWLRADPKRNYILSSRDFYESPYLQPGIHESKAARDADFNRLLSQRAGAFSDMADKYNVFRQPLPRPEQFHTAINSPMFHENFHHSEQAIMHYLSSRDGINQVVQTSLNIRAAYHYGMVVDIYTQRMMCCNCNMCLLGMQASHEYGYLYDLSEALERASIQPRVGNNLMLSTRVSASKAPKGATLDPLRLPNDQGRIHQYDPDLVSQVFQAENKALGTEHLINHHDFGLQTYKGCFFASKTFSKEKLEKDIRSVYQTEYIDKSIQKLNR